MIGYQYSNKNDGTWSQTYGVTDSVKLYDYVYNVDNMILMRGYVKVRAMSSTGDYSEPYIWFGITNMPVV